MTCRFQNRCLRRTGRSVAHPSQTCTNQIFSGSAALWRIGFTFPLATSTIDNIELLPGPGSINSILAPLGEISTDLGAGACAKGYGVGGDRRVRAPRRHSYAQADRRSDQQHSEFTKISSFPGNGIVHFTSASQARVLALVECAGSAPRHDFSPARPNGRRTRRCGSAFRAIPSCGSATSSPPSAKSLRSPRRSTPTAEAKRSGWSRRMREPPKPRASCARSPR